MKFLACVLIALLASGCGHLRPDPVPISAIDANYPTAEFRACGKHWHGLGLCSVEKGEPYDTVSFKIQGYFKGILAVDSKDCGIEIRREYKDNELISIPIPGDANKNCLLTFTVAPKYPKQDNQNIQVHNFRGHLAIRVLDEPERPWEPRIRKVSGNYSSELRMFYGPPNGGVRLVADGCGRDDPYNEQRMLDDAGYLNFNLVDIMPVLEQPKVCMMEGFIASTHFEDVDFNIFVAKYSSEFTKLPIPDIQINGNEIKVTANDAVSIISIDGEYEIDHEAKFDFDWKKAHVMRLLTVKGRSVLGFWAPGGQQWQWVQ